jgi:polar amino acid transport system substrate-binding protein
MRILIVFIGLLCFFKPVFACDENKARELLSHYKWMTEDYPPYQFLDEDNKLSGIYIDLLFAIYQQIGLELTRRDIYMVPWARLYHQLQFDNTYAGFSMINTPERSKVFTLISLPIPERISILVKAEEAKPMSLSGINGLNIAVVREDIGQHLLNKYNIGANQVETSSARSMLEMLMLHRVDAVAYAEDVATFQMKKLNINIEQLVPILVLDDSSFNSYVFHKDTPQCVIELFTKAIDEIHQQGKLGRIWDRYLQ